MWGSINFDVTEITEQAVALINQFMPLIYVIGGIAVFGMVVLIVVAIARKSSTA